VSTIQSDASIRIVGALSKSTQWVLAATWTEPEKGICIHGIYWSKQEAVDATYTDEVRECYANDDEDGEPLVTDDVEWIIAPLGEPFLI